MTVGTQYYATRINKRRQSAYFGGYAKALFSISVEVPAHTRYTASFNFASYATAKDGSNRNKSVGGYVYNMGTNIKNVPRTYYVLSNNPSQYRIAGSYRNASNGTGAVSTSANVNKTIYFDNASGETQIITQYFVATSGLSRTYLNNTYGDIAYVKVALNSELTQQRLVPTSYDVEYDQLRHSLEEEYYEAIRLDENYPTEGVRVTSGYTGGWNGMANCIDYADPLIKRGNAGKFRSSGF